MKTIVAGSRDYDNYKAVASVLDRCPWLITEVICGEAQGPDTLGKRWAEDNQIKMKSFPADWDGLGRKAGPVRNRQMAEYSEGAVIFWDRKSRGAKSMIDYSLEYGLHLLVVMV